MGLTRAEREQRIEHDDGDPDDTVYYTRSRPSTYHARQNCRATGDAELREVDRAAAQRRVLAPCRFCVLDDVERSGGTETPLPRDLVSRN